MKTNSFNELANGVSLYPENLDLGLKNVLCRDFSGAILNDDTIYSNVLNMKENIRNYVFPFLTSLATKINLNRPVYFYAWHNFELVISFITVTGIPCRLAFANGKDVKGISRIDDEGNYYREHHVTLAGRYDVRECVEEYLDLVHLYATVHDAESFFFLASQLPTAAASLISLTSTGFHRDNHNEDTSAIIDILKTLSPYYSKLIDIATEENDYLIHFDGITERSAKIKTKHGNKKTTHRLFVKFNENFSDIEYVSFNSKWTNSKTEYTIFKDITVKSEIFDFVKKNSAFVKKNPDRAYVSDSWFI